MSGPLVATWSFTHNFEHSIAPGWDWSRQVSNHGDRHLMFRIRSSDAQALRDQSEDSR